MRAHPGVELVHDGLVGPEKGRIGRHHVGPPERRGHAGVPAVLVGRARDEPVGHGGRHPLAQPGAHEGRASPRRPARPAPGWRWWRRSRTALRWRGLGGERGQRLHAEGPIDEAARARQQPPVPDRPGVVGQVPGQKAGIGEGAAAQIFQVVEVGGQQPGGDQGHAAHAGPLRARRVGQGRPQQQGAVVGRLVAGAGAEGAGDEPRPDRPQQAPGRRRCGRRRRRCLRPPGRAPTTRGPPACRESPGPRSRARPARCRGGGPAVVCRWARVSPACCSLRTARVVCTRNRSSRDRLAITGCSPPAAAARWRPRSARPGPSWARDPGRVAPSADTRVTALASLPKPRPGAPTSLATTRSQPFSSSLARARATSWSGVRPVSAANPTRNGVGPAPAGSQRREQVGVGHQGQGQRLGWIGRPPSPQASAGRACRPGGPPGGSRPPPPPSRPRRPGPPAALEGGLHVEGALDVHPAGHTAPGVGSATGPAIRVTSRAQGGRRAGQGEAHLPRGAIAQEAHVVDRLEGRDRRSPPPACPPSAAAGRAPGQDRLGLGDHLGGVHQAPGADPAAGQLAPVGPDRASPARSPAAGAGCPG